ATERRLQVSRKRDVKILSAFTLIRAHPLPNFGLNLTGRSSATRGRVPWLSDSLLHRGQKKTPSFSKTGCEMSLKILSAFTLIRAHPLPNFGLNLTGRSSATRGRVPWLSDSLLHRDREKTPTFSKTGCQNFICFHSDKGPPTPEFWA